MRRGWLVGSLVLAVTLWGSACDSKKGATTTSSSPSNGAASSTTANRHQPGDWVIYRYSGTFTKAPVKVVQRVLSVETKDGKDRVTTGVHMERGTERMKFVQVTDGSLASKKAGDFPSEVIEYLPGGKEQALKGAEISSNVLFRLWNWTLPANVQGQPKNRTQSQAKVGIGAASFDCTQEEVDSEIGGKPVHLVLRQCDGFPWYKGPSEVKLVDGTVYWQADVLAYGTKDNFPAAEASAMDGKAPATP